MAIRIITDSTADFTRDEAAQLGIEIVPLKTRFGDEEYIDGVTISPREFYEKLVESDVMPSTSWGAGHRGRDSRSCRPG